MLYIPSSKTLVASDMLFNKVYLWLNEKRFKEWINNLEDIKIMDVDVVYPGHGEVSDISLVDVNIEYIRNYEKIVKSSKNADEAIVEMKKLYPDYKLDRFLTYGVNNYFQPAH
jgi:glyoxylase-like metal-dependent hydrolase (beta-lactamase superfamily II)